MEYNHNVIDDDPHFIIDPETRTISYVSPEKLVLIQGDHNSERFTFELPKLIDNHEMAGCNLVQVHYININGSDTSVHSAGVYEVKDLKLSDDGEKVVLSWLVSQNATRYVGSLNFAVRFICKAADGSTEYAWNTAPYSSVTISTGIDNTEGVVEEYYDVLETWYNQLVGAGTTSLESIEEAKNEAIAEVDAQVKASSDVYAEKLKSTLTVDVLGVENVLVQEKGNNPDKIMSQKSVTTELNKIESDYKNEMVNTVNEVREIAANITKNSLVPIIIKGAGTEENPYYFEVEIGQKYRIYRTKTNNEWDVMFTIITGSTQQQASIPANPYRDFSTIIVKSVEYVNAGGGLISDLRIRYELDGSNCVRNFDLENPVEMWNRVYIDNVDKAYLVDEDAEYITDANGIADITKTASGLHGVDVYYANDEVKNWTEEGSGCTACIVTDLPASMRVSSNGIYHFYVIESSGEIYISLDGTTGQRFIDHYEGTAGWSEGWLDDVPDTSTQMGYYAVRTFKPLTDTYTISFDNGETRTFTVENGNGISSVERTDRGDYEDTYTMYLTDGTSTTFKVPNGGSVGIKKTVSGETISINDISPIEHGVKVNVKSKNLIGYFLSDKEVVRDGVTFIVSAYDDTITLNGTCGTEAGGRNLFNDVAMPFTLERGKTYTLSQELVSGTVTGGAYGVYISTLDGYDVVANISSAGADLVKTFIPEETVECFIGVNIVANTTYEDAVIRFQLEEGPVATSYTPYVDISTVKLRASGKNRIPFPYPLLSGTIQKNGLTIAVQDDGGVLIDGTATAETYINLANVTMGPKTIYPYSTHGLVSSRYSGDLECCFDGSNGLTYIRVANGMVCDNIVFYPQIEAGTVSTAYEKGIPAVVYTPNLDGSVSGVDSIAPVMNVFADKPGVIIEAKYNKNIEAMLEEVGEVKNHVTQAEAYANEAKAASNAAAANVAAKAEEMIADLGIVQEAGTSSAAVMSQAGASTAFAGAVKKTMKGEVIRVYDVSPVPHKVKIKVTCPDGVDPTSVIVTAGSKNLIPFPYPKLSGTTTNSGITATVQDDGGIIFNGTSTELTYWRLCNMSFATKSIESYLDYEWVNTRNYRFLSSGSYFTCGWTTVVDSGNKACMIKLKAGTYNNLLVYPTVEYGLQVSDYEKGSAHSVGSPNADGIVMLNAIAPTMTVASNIEGVILEVEYNADVIEDKLDNATIKRTSRGKIVTINDAVDVSRDVKVNLHVPDGVDPASIDVITVKSKNLLDFDRGTYEYGGTVVKNDDGSYTFTKVASNHRMTYRIPVLMEPGKVYRLNTNIVETNYDGTIGCLADDRDGTSKSFECDVPYVNSIYRYWIRLYFSVEAPVGSYVKFKPHLEEIPSIYAPASEYEEFKGETYRASPDGTVIGITSSHNMQMHARYPRNSEHLEDYELEVEYEVDAKSEIDKINRVINFPYDDYNLPIVYFEGDISEMTKDIKANLTYKYGDRTGTCTLKWQGSSSIAYPKKNYTVVFDNAFEAVEGWGEESKYCLKADWIDASHIRNITAAKLWGEIVKSRSASDLVTRLSALPNGGAIDGFPCFVVINGVWQGIYNFNIPKEGYMFGMKDDTAKHAILCAGNSSLPVRFMAEATIDTHFDLEYNSDAFSASEIQTSLNRLINACINSDGTDIDTTIAQYLDINSAIDYMIFAALVRGIDIVEKNYILATYDGTKWFFSAYDLDCIFGLHWDGHVFLTSGYNAGDGLKDVSFASLVSSNRLFQLLYTYKRSEIVARYKELRTKILSTASVMNKFYNAAAQIPRTAFDAEVALWKDIPSQNGNDADHIATWYLEHVKWVDNELLGVSGELNGKKISLNGDSICAGNGYAGGYGKIIADRNSMLYENIAVSGATIAGGTSASHYICRTIENMDVNADYVIVEGGINDAANSVSLGSISSGYTATLNDTTFYGAFESMCKKLLERFPNKKVGYIFVHKAHSRFDSSNGGSDYYKAAKECCEKWGIPYCDLNTQTPPLGYISSLKAAYTLNGDGLHPNEEGYKKYYCDKIEAWLKTL